MSKTAWLHVKQASEYPYEALRQGLENAGYQLNNGPSDQTEMLVTWTPWKGSIANREGLRHRARWLVVENGYVPAINGERYYSIGLGGYNGTQRYIPALGRNLGLRFKPWRKNGEYVLIVGQFGHRDTRFSMPVDWLLKMVRHLRNLTDEMIVLRPKGRGRGVVPNKNIINKLKIDNDTSLEDQLKNARCLVTWNSPSITVRSLLEGVPVIIDAPTCIAKDFGGTIKNINELLCPDNREDLGHVISNSQWSEQEIASGRPFTMLERHLK